MKGIAVTVKYYDELLIVKKRNSAFYLFNNLPFKKKISALLFLPWTLFPPEGYITSWSHLLICLISKRDKT